MFFFFLHAVHYPNKTAIEYWLFFFWKWCAKGWGWVCEWDWISD